MTDFVLDNSVTMRWCFDAGLHPFADRILELLETREAVAFVPVLWRYEVSSVLARAQNKGFLPAYKGALFLESLSDLPIAIDGESVDRVLTGVHQIALRYRLTSYDAAYLEVALRMRLPMVTLDDELRAACGAAGVGLM